MDSRGLSSKSRQLLEVGISTDALHTTLPREGRQDLRKMIENRAYYVDDSSVCNLVFLVKHEDHRDEMMLIMDLVAKEMSLSGLSIIMPSVEEVIEENDASIYESMGIDFVFFQDFYVHHGSKQAYGTPREVSRLFRIMRQWYYRYNIGIAMYLEGNALSAATTWWTHKMLNFINRSSNIIQASRDV